MPTQPSSSRSTQPGSLEPPLSAPGNDDRSWTGALRDAATEKISNQKQRASEGIGGVARILRESTDRLQDEGQTTVANYARQTADHLERFSRRLETQDLDDVLRNAQRFARTQPWVFVAAAFGVGLCAARFFKSSADDRAGARNWDSQGGTFYTPPATQPGAAGGFAGPTT